MIRKKFQTIGEFMKTIRYPNLSYHFLFALGAVGYFCIELLYRGYSHWTMMLCGGASLVFISGFNRRFPRVFLPIRAAICAVFITSIELMFGIIDNIVMGWHIWDYSKIPLNFMGQICLSFSLYWYILSIPLCILSAKRTLKKH